MLVEPGTYVAARATNPNSGGSSNSYAKGTLAFDVKAGQALYVGDYSFHYGDWKAPDAGKVAGDFIKGFFSVGLAMPKQPVYSADITSDEKRAQIYAESRTTALIALERAPLDYVDFPDESSRAY